MRRTVCVGVIGLFLAGCGTTPAESAPSSGSAVPTTSVPPTPELSLEPSPDETSTPRASAGPRQLFGTWRTTLAGEQLSLNLTETTYRIVRGGNVGAGSVRVTDDQIEFFDSSLCSGTGVWRWAISDGALTFFPVETEPCPGRAEALLVSYPDYSPPSGG